MKAKWKHFIDKRGDTTKKVLMNGSELTRTLTDVYFEIEIQIDGTIHIQVEQDQYVFYKKKLKKLYKAVFDKLCAYTDKKEYAFYNEKTRTYNRLVEKVYSSVENENW
ncbi:MAG: hypothetical protein SLAVMIC_00469 [uncultured marine phage]|uniref:Uncharacterized protein n=1 Tax=uncultured marine phage TaxID=707152 RepID=A0A8D9C8Z6_9VIRU|nr:MAG: hypothetical protein SLAVMIC_00469 [uncultured marine phage]